MQSKQQYSNRNRDLSHASGKSSTLPRNIHSKNTQNHVQSKRVNDDLMYKNQKVYDSNKLSNSPSKSDLLREHVNTLQTSTTKASMRVVNPPQLNNEPGIIDGYLENVSFF